MHKGPFSRKRSHMYEVIDEKQSVKDKELIFDRMERGGGMTVPHLVIFGSKYARV